MPSVERELAIESRSTSWPRSSREPPVGRGLGRIETRKIETLTEHEDVGDDVAVAAGNAVGRVVAAGAGIGVGPGDPVEIAREHQRPGGVGELPAGALGERPARLPPEWSNWPRRDACRNRAAPREVWCTPRRSPGAGESIPRVRSAPRPSHSTTRRRASRQGRPTTPSRTQDVVASCHFPSMAPGIDARHRRDRCHQREFGSTSLMAQRRRSAGRPRRLASPVSLSIVETTLPARDRNTLCGTAELAESSLAAHSRRTGGPIRIRPRLPDGQAAPIATFDVASVLGSGKVSLRDVIKRARGRDPERRRRGFYLARTKWRRAAIRRRSTTAHRAERIQCEDGGNSLFGPGNSPAQFVFEPWWLAGPRKRNNGRSDQVATDTFR